MFEDQMVICERWPDPKCKCGGRGHFGLLLKEIKPRVPFQPNQLCPCNSGKKYKKCCSEMIERMRRGGGAILNCSCVGKYKLAQNDLPEQLREELLSKAREQLTNQ